MVWYCPVPPGSEISQTFQQHPYYGKGVDFAVPTHTPVFAMGSGRITRVVNTFRVNQTGKDLGYANLVVIDHGRIEGAGYISYYAHLSPDIPVRVGDLVKVGQGCLS